MNFKVRPHISDFEVVSYAQIPECIKAIPKEKLIDCSYGVNPFSFSEKISEFIKNLGKDEQCTEYIGGYPDVQYSEICASICKAYGEGITFSPENIRVGTGSVCLIERLSKLFIDKGTRVLGFCPQFTDFMSNVQMNGGIYESVPLKAESNYKFSVDDLIQAIRPEHVVVYIDNPSNPTGQVISCEDIEKVCVAAAKHNITVISDEAYGDFIGLESSMANMVAKHKNLVVMRTFSKGLGLAGLRCGYLISSRDFFVQYDKIDVPFSVTTLASKMVCIGILDKEFAKNSSEKISQIKQAVRAELKGMTAWETDNRVPIMTVEHPDKNVDLFELFARHNVFAEPAHGFHSMPKNAARIRVLADSAPLIEVLRKIEAEI